MKGEEKEIIKTEDVRLQDFYFYFSHYNSQIWLAGSIFCDILFTSACSNSSLLCHTVEALLYTPGQERGEHGVAEPQSQLLCKIVLCLLPRCKPTLILLCNNVNKIDLDLRDDLCLKELLKDSISKVDFQKLYNFFFICYK